jgi:hypothetical protein
MAGAEGHRPTQGISAETILALANGTLLQQLGELSTRIISALGDAVEVSRAIEAGSLEKLAEALEQAASEEDNSVVLQTLKEAVGDQPFAEPSLLARAAISGVTPATAVSVEAFAQRELAIRLAARERLPLRQEHRRTAFDIADQFYKELDYERAEAFTAQTGHYFHRIYVPGRLYGPDAQGDQDQCVFVPTASGQEMTLRRLDHNTDEGRKVGFSLVLKLEPTDDPLHPDNVSTGPGGGYRRFGVLYATLTDKEDSTIQYTNPEVNDNAVLAEAADRDLIEKFRETTEALNARLAEVEYKEI